MRLNELPPRKQDAVLWVKTGTDDFGQEIYEGPHRIKCRWDDLHEQFVSLAGTITVSNAKVYPNRDITEGDVLWKGKLEDFHDDWDKPKENAYAFEVMKVERTPDFDAKKMLIIAML